MKLLVHRAVVFPDADAYARGGIGTPVTLRPDPDDPAHIFDAPDELRETDTYKMAVKCGYIRDLDNLGQEPTVPAYTPPYKKPGGGTFRPYGLRAEDKPKRMG